MILFALVGHIPEDELGRIHLRDKMAREKGLFPASVAGNTESGRGTQ